MGRHAREQPLVAQCGGWADERLNLVTVRDTPERRSATSKVVAPQRHRSEPEVAARGGDPEVKRHAAAGPGIRWPEQLSPVAAAFGERRHALRWPTRQPESRRHRRCGGARPRGPADLTATPTSWLNHGGRIRAATSGEGVRSTLGYGSARSTSPSPSTPTTGFAPVKPVIRRRRPQVDVEPTIYPRQRGRDLWAGAGGQRYHPARSGYAGVPAGTRTASTVPA